MPAHRAAIYVLAGRDETRSKLLCMQYVERKGLDLVAVVIDNGDGWASVQALLDEDKIDILVTRPGHLPPDRTPRIDYAGEEGEPGPRQRRPRIRQRSGEAGT